MSQEYVLKMSELKSAGERKDLKTLSELFASARKVLESGGEVRLDKEYSDAAVETVHVIDSVEGLQRLEEKYLS